VMPDETPTGVLSPFEKLPTLPGAKLQAQIAKGEYKAFTGKELEREKWFPAWLLEKSHPFVRAAAQGLEKAGVTVVHGTYNFCTNAAYSIGIAGVPTIGFGPSPEGLAHIVDEYIEIEQLVKAAHGYKGIIESVLSN